ncbi:echinoderm microtubule-associated protein-like 1 [Lemur catta]|uniref:echinoderm microtubule-associated protein-like 1 n=1 Tax=Lemur catta TaxID=9447 RepID=UPI001E26C097|nr:echinoderm microtubule-associated protein-like 1 [Lemur catta]
MPLGFGAPGWPLQPALPRLPDDNLSGTSGMEVDDRVSALEQRLQLQEDELAVLKAALADALRRLRACEEQGAALRARGTPKGRAPPRLGTTASGIPARLEG